MADEDAPPTASVNDIVNDVYLDTPPRRKSVTFNTKARVSYYRPASPQAPPTPKPSSSAANSNNELYVIVFGYPADKYSVTAEYFKALGDSTDADQNNEIMNCFRIGYSNPTDALRAVRKNGEVIGGHWMVGAKWAVRTTKSDLCFSDILMSSHTGPCASRKHPRCISRPLKLLLRLK